MNLALTPNDRELLTDALMAHAADLACRIDRAGIKASTSIRRERDETIDLMRRIREAE